MEYAKLQLVDLRKPAWRLASMHARGAAVTILAFCADHETGGRIEAAREWDPDTWRDIVGVRPIDVQRAIDAGLCWWEGDDLMCALYDSIGHARLQVQRQQGPHGARGGRPRKTPLPENPKGSEPGNPKGYQSGNPEASEPETPSPDQTIPVQTRPDQDTAAAAARDPRAREPEPSCHVEPDAPETDEPQPPATPQDRDREDRLLAFVLDHGGVLDDPDGADLRPKWREALRGLREPEARFVFERGPAAVGHSLVYPTGFVKARGKLRDELAALTRQAAEAAAAKRDARAGAALRSVDQERAAAQDQANAAAAEPAQRIIAHLAQLDAEARDRIAAEVAGNASARSALAAAAVAMGGGKPLSWIQVRALRQASPTLAAVADGRTEVPT
jgi:hypothetical protein